MKGGENVEEKYIAHVYSGRIQGLKEHLDNVFTLAGDNCPISYLKPIVKVAALLHDDGKIGQEFQDYMRDIVNLGYSHKNNGGDHSTAGGKILERMVKSKQDVIREVIGNLVYSHHGLKDCIDMESGETLSDKRNKSEIDVDYIEKCFYEMYEKNDIKKLVLESCKGLREEYKNINSFVNKENDFDVWGSRDFYEGMYERLMLSVLIDSDWSDTASFSDDESLSKKISQDELDDIWESCITNFNEHMDQIEHSSSKKSVLNIQRNRISNLCYEASKEEFNRYRLTVPTGSGKTYSSLRFALNRALNSHKSHIFYVAPYNSILEQNADEIRSAIGNDGYVLEHHCNVIYDDVEDDANYRKLTERWSRPIILTTAVQMLNTLFSDNKSCIRRMYSLCNSVIIFDEVQAVPMKCTDLFNLAVNFLSQCCNTTVVLCSATQPSLAVKDENNILQCNEMAGKISDYVKEFKRVEFVDESESVKGGMDIENLKTFVLNVFKSNGNTLVIVNTKAVARKLYQALDECCDDFELYHLSTNMCPEHRDDTLNKIRRSLKECVPTICVSTQLVEAGVDLSFDCVVRSLTGLDGIVQAAGRCNRHKEKKNLGKVFIVKMKQEVENIGRMKEMLYAQEACEDLLRVFKETPERLDYALDTQTAIKKYYEIYQSKLKINLGENVMKYPVPDYDTDIVEMLGRNKVGNNQKNRHYVGVREMTELPHLKQAFETAGKKFEVISEDGKNSIIVPYGDSGILIEALSKAKKTSDAKNILRRLQRYTVQISDTFKKSCGNAIYPAWENDTYSGSDIRILTISSSYYSEKIGITDEPQNTFMNF